MVIFPLLGLGGRFYVTPPIYSFPGSEISTRVLSLLQTVTERKSCQFQLAILLNELHVTSAPP